MAVEQLRYLSFFSFFLAGVLFSTLREKLWNKNKYVDRHSCWNICGSSINGDDGRSWDYFDVAFNRDPIIPINNISGVTTINRKNTSSTANEYNSFTIHLKEETETNYDIRVVIKTIEGLLGHSVSKVFPSLKIIHFESNIEEDIVEDLYEELADITDIIYRKRLSINATKSQDLFERPVFVSYDEGLSEYSTVPILNFVNYSENANADALITVVDPGTITRPPLALNWGLDRIDQWKTSLSGGPDYSPHPSTNNGSGVTIFVLDTGIDELHTEFIGKTCGIVRRVDYKRNEKISDVLLTPSNQLNEETISLDGLVFSPMTTMTTMTTPTTKDLRELTDDDVNGHGTHIAAIAAGRFVGVAPCANIVSFKVLGDNGGGNNGDLIQVMDLILEHKLAFPNDKMIASISISSSRDWTLNTATKMLAQKGVPVVVSAGNDRTNACTRSPAGAWVALTVGAITQGDRLWEHSNFGKCVEIYAPGHQIQSACSSDSLCSRSKNMYSQSSGTSMSVPFVSGVIALYMSQELFFRNPASPTPWEIKQLMKCTSTNDKIINLNRVDPSGNSMNRLLRAPKNPTSELVEKIKMCMTTS